MMNVNTSSFMTVALLSERSAAVILRPKSANTILLNNSFATDIYSLSFTRCNTAEFQMEKNAVVGVLAIKYL